jgi:hypothetical protein
MTMRNTLRVVIGEGEYSRGGILLGVHDYAK